MKERVSKLPPDSYISLAAARCRGCNSQCRRGASTPSCSRERSDQFHLNHQLGLGIVGGRLHRATVSERKLRRWPFVFCMVNRLPVFLPDLSSVSRRVMTGASCSDGRLMRNSCRQEARSCSRADGLGALPDVNHSWCFDLLSASTAYHWFAGQSPETTPGGAFLNAGRRGGTPPSRTN